MPDGITAIAADGTQHVFPGGTDPSIVDGVMKKYATRNDPSMPTAPQMSGLDMKYGAYGFTPGNMWSSAKDLVKGTAGMVNDVFLKPGMPMTPEEAQATAKKKGQPVQEDLYSKYVGNPAEQQEKTAQALTAAKHPIAGEIQHELTGAPFIGPIIGSAMEKIREGDVGGPTTQAAGAWAGGKTLGALGRGAEVLTGQRSLADTVTGKSIQEISGVGQSHANLKSYLHDSATTKIQPVIKGLSSAVHDEAQQALASTIQKMDAAHPEGIAKSDIRPQIKEAVGELVKTPEKLPPSVAKLLDEPTTEGKTGWGKSSGPPVGGRHFNLNDPNDLKAYTNMKSQGVFSPEEVARMEGKGGTDSWTAAELQQARSAVGRELGSYGNRGAMGAAINRVYGILSDKLRSTAKESGLEEPWLEGNAKWQGWVNDFIRGPLKGTLKGQNATDITEPLTGKNSEVVNRILQKYSDKLSPDTLKQFSQEVNKHTLGKTVQRWSQPSKLDLIIAALSPKAAAMRVGIPRAMRSPKTIEAITGKGLPEIPTKQVAHTAPKE